MFRSCLEKMSHNSIMICYLFFFSFFILGHGLKCYECLSTSSWDDCDQQEKACSLGFDACFKVYAKLKQGAVSITQYHKGCTTQQICKEENHREICKDAVPGECTINCCSGDLCNTAAIQVINVVFLVLCAFLASVMIQ